MEFAAPAHLAPFLLSLATLASTLVGGLLAIRIRERPLIFSYSAGALTAVALVDMLPESLSLTRDVHSAATVFLCVAAGFVLYLMLNQGFALRRSAPAMGPATLVFHSLIDGIALGLSFSAGSRIGWIVAAAILTHDFSDGINTVGLALRGKGDVHFARSWLLADAIAPVAGVLTTFMIAVSPAGLGLVLGIFAGFFLYTGAFDLLPESLERGRRAAQLAMAGLGFGTITAVVWMMR